MKVFKVVETCTISWRDPINRANDLVLYPGDFFFIEENMGWERKQTGTYNWDEYMSFDMLVKIYHRKLNAHKALKEDIMEYNWTWLNDINLVSPAIDGEYNVRDWKEFCPNKLEDVSISWERDEKLNKLLINDN